MAIITIMNVICYFLKNCGFINTINNINTIKKCDNRRECEECRKKIGKKDIIYFAMDRSFCSDNCRNRFIEENIV